MSKMVLEREGVFLGSFYGGEGRGTLLRLDARCELTPDEADGVAEMIRDWAQEVRRHKARASAEMDDAERARPAHCEECGHPAHSARACGALVKGPRPEADDRCDCGARRHEEVGRWCASCDRFVPQEHRCGGDA